MSEKLAHHESEHQPVNPESSAEQNEKLRDKLESASEAKNEAKDAIESIRSSINKEASSSKNSHVGETNERDKGSVPMLLNKSVKKAAYTKELQKVRRHLSAPNKALSKIVHKPAVEQVSEVGSKTIARPSGLLGGGLVAFAGSGALLWASRHYGFEYNYFVFVILLIGGFFAGLIVELALRTIIKRA